MTIAIKMIFAESKKVFLLKMVRARKVVKGDCVKNPVHKK